MLRALLYDRLRRSVSPGTRQWLKHQRWFTPLSRVLFANAVYSKSYFDDIERLEARSVHYIADWICTTLAPRRAIDLGCGPGHLMAALRDRGVEVYGVDVSDVAIARCQSKHLRADRADLTKSRTSLLGVPYDLAISFEVAEHLDAASAGTFVDKLVDAAPRVLLTAAEPGLASGVGLHHVNEQPNEYWIELFVRRGFVLDRDVTHAARESFNCSAVIEYLRRPMVFRKLTDHNRNSHLEH